MGHVQYRICLFGNPRVFADETELHISRKKSLGLLAYVAVSDIKLSRSQLCGILWPEKDESHARGALRTALSTLNSEMGSSLIDSTGDYFIIDDSVWIDVRDFRSKTRKLEKNILYDSQALQELNNAVSLYSGDFLSGFSIGQDSIIFEDWQYMQLENLKLSYSKTLERLVQSYTLISNFKKATITAEKWSENDPENELIHRRLMELYAWQGRKRDALHQYEKCRSILNRGMDLEPEESTIRLYDSIKNNRIVIPETDNDEMPEISDEPVLDSSVFYSTVLSVGLTNSAEKILIQRPYDTASMIDILFHRTIENTLKKYSVNGWFFIGDTLVALFGIPNSVADDAYRALMASIEILQEASGYGFTMTAGIATGLVYFRTEDSLYKNSSIIGPAVTEASLMRFYGEPGMIFAESSTWTNIKSTAVFEKQERVIPGMSRSKEIYRLRKEDNQAARFM
jgi:DNA-binding SARP family transcriptional activator